MANKTTEEKYQAIKIPVETYEQLKALRLLLIQTGISNFPQPFKEYITEHNARVLQDYKWSFGNLVDICMLAIKFLFGV